MNPLTSTWVLVFPDDEYKPHTKNPHWASPFAVELLADARGPLLGWTPLFWGALAIHSGGDGLSWLSGRVRSASFPPAVCL